MAERRPTYNPQGRHDLRRTPAALDSRAMPRDRIHLHLDPPQLAQVREGRFPLVDRIAGALAPLDIALDIRADTQAERHAAQFRPGWSLFHLHEPEAPRQMTLRRAYFFPFWRIERTNARWHFAVVSRHFDPACIDPVPARRFRDRLRQRICGDLRPARLGYIHMPLQGRLLERRSFQSMSPIDMIRTMLDADPRDLRATLHPNESYTTGELAALESLAARNPRLRLLPPDPGHLAGCDLVVTQNSSVAMTGFLLDKPALLFAGIDFHHIAASVPRDGLQAALNCESQPAPDFAAYLWWFFKDTCIDAMADASDGQILAQLRAAGWPH